MTSNRKAVILALLAVLLWSTAATAFKIALEELDFVNLLLYSSITSTMVFLAIIILTKKTAGFFSGKAIINSAVLGFLNPFLYYMVLLKAYSVLPAQVAQPLNYLWPVMLSLLAVPFLKQKLRLAAFIGLIVSFAGVAVISQQGKWFQIADKDVTGVLLASGSSVIWALYWLFNLKDKREDAPRLFLNFLFGTIYITIYILIFHNFRNPVSKGGLASVYVGFFEMGFTFLLWMLALQKSSSAAKISNLVFLSPFLSLVFIHFILKEDIFITTIPGIILILAGIMVSNAGRKKQDEKNV